MKGGSKYQPLLEYLRRSNQRELTLSFAQIELIINDILPDSARRNRGWWSNRTRGAVQATAWMEAGYIADVHIKEESVTFRKPPPKYEVQPVDNPVKWNRETIKAMRLHMGLTQKEFADQLLVRQQTVSEWENGVYEPKRNMSQSLNCLAERTGFKYREGG